MHYLLFIFAVLFWSGNFVVGRGIHNEIPPITLAFWRWAVVLLIILPFSLRHVLNQKDLIQRNWKILTLLAIIFLNEKLRGYHIIGTILIFTGIFLTTAGKIKSRR